MPPTASQLIPGARVGSWDPALCPADLAASIRADLQTGAIDEITQTMATAAAMPNPSPEVLASLAAAVAALHHFREAAGALAVALEGRRRR